MENSQGQSYEKSPLPSDQNNLMATQSGGYPGGPAPPSYNNANSPGYPNQGYPSQGYPSQGYPSQGYPSQGYPGQGFQGQASNVIVGQPQTVVFLQPQMLDNPPDDYLCYSVFVTLCCCLFIGIFAIVKSVECRSAIRAGNRPEAEQKSRDARKLSHIGLGIGLAFLVVYIILVVLRVMAASTRY